MSEQPTQPAPSYDAPHAAPDNDRAMLRTYLAQRDESCPLCGYNLRGLQGGNCPECGHELVLKIDLADPVRGAYVAGLIGLSTGLGFNGLILVVTIILAIFFGNGPPAGVYAYLGLATLVCLAVLGLWMKRSANIRRLSRGARMAWALACWSCPLLSVASLCLQILMS